MQHHTPAPPCWHSHTHRRCLDPILSLSLSLRAENWGNRLDTHAVSVSYIQKRQNKSATKLLPTASVCRGLQILFLLCAQPTYYPAPIPNSTHPLLTQSPVRPKFKSSLFLLSALRQPNPPLPFCPHPLLIHQASPHKELLPAEAYVPQSLTSMHNKSYLLKLSSALFSQFVYSRS